jgi:hypothetical protein
MGKKQSELDELSRAVVRMQAGILALVFALICGLGLFIMTAWLVIKNGPMTGMHLQLLNNYFLGYSVSWTGSFVGFFYGALVGAVIGWAIGKVYNRIVGLRFP